MTKLIQRYKHHLLPSLKDLSLDDPFVDAADAKRFFESLPTNEAFPTVRNLTVASKVTGINFLASAFAGGAFAGLDNTGHFARH